MGVYPDHQVLERRAVPKGTVIIREGDNGDSAFLIQSGKVRVFARHGEKTIELAKLGSGQIFGEMALVFDEKRSASVEALEDSVLVILTRKTLDEKLRKSDPTVRAIALMLMKRVMQGNETLLSRHADLNVLVETANNICGVVMQSLPRVQQQSFQNAVLPKLDQFLEAVQTFQDKYRED